MEHRYEKEFDSIQDVFELQVRRTQHDLAGAVQWLTGLSSAT